MSHLRNGEQLDGPDQERNNGDVGNDRQARLANATDGGDAHIAALLTTQVFHAQIDAMVDHAKREECLERAGRRATRLEEHGEVVAARRVMKYEEQGKTG